MANAQSSVALVRTDQTGKNMNISRPSDQTNQQKPCEDSTGDFNERIVRKLEASNNPSDGNYLH